MSKELIFFSRTYVGLNRVNYSDPNKTRTRKKSTYFYSKVVDTKCLVDNCLE